MKHDSGPDTQKHIDTVRRYLDEVTSELRLRGLVHDASKLEEPEKAIFDEYTNKLKHTEYASKEYKRFTSEMRPAIQHHYSVNTHHPEHYPDGLYGFDLLDLVEMLCDWKAATERTKNGDIRKSIIYNAERFNIDPQLVSILVHTVERMDW